MPPPIVALEAESDLDLAGFCRELWKRRINHRVVTQDGRKFLITGNDADAERIRQLHLEWLQGDLQHPPVSGTDNTAASLRSGFAVAGRYPVLSCVVLLAVLCYPLAWSLDSGQLNTLFSALNMVPVTQSGAQLHFAALSEALERGQLWRLITPVFLHFSAMHLIFDVTVVVEFGRRVEYGLGSWRFVALFVWVAVLSNLVQYWVQGPGVFGGLSGVAYGLVGFVVVMHRIRPGQSCWNYQRPLVVGLLVFLLLFTTGVTEFFGLYIANAAHWAGLASGAAAAFVFQLRKIE